jgi:uncharacterized protein (DUF362 family)
MIAVFRDTRLLYPTDASFHPPEDYPEYPYRGRGFNCPGNQIYPAVRETLSLLRLDENNRNTPQWNPLEKYIKPGDMVALKPNLVQDRAHDNGLQAMVTHASVIRAVLDYVVLALKGSGRIVIGDSPLQTADFDAIIRGTHLDRVVEFSRTESGLEIELCDFRRERSRKDQQGVIEMREPVAGTHGHAVVRLDGYSHFSEVGQRIKRFRVTNYVPELMTLHHNEAVHEYLIAKPVLQANCVINLPKLKTHRKAGITAALKNMVGINGSKDWLPHHTNGSAKEGGDQYPAPSLRKRIMTIMLDRKEASPHYAVRKSYALMLHLLCSSRRIRPFPDPYYEGNWYGNDTLWRTILDLNRILFYATSKGELRCNTRQRHYFALVDAVVAGEGEGPLEATPRACGALVAGDNPVSLDVVCAYLMGFDPFLIPTIRNGMQDNWLEYDREFMMRSNYWPELKTLAKTGFRFVPSKGWEGHIELGGQ